MKEKFTDFSQLKRDMFKASPPEEEQQSEEIERPGLSPDDEAVLAYFARPGGGMARGVGKSRFACEQAPEVTGRPAVGGSDAATLAEQLREEAALRREAEARVVTFERTCADMDRELAAARREIARLQGEAGRLAGELRKAAQAVGACEEAKSKSPCVSSVAAPVGGVLAVPADFAEAFPGEMREMLLTVLSEARDAAVQGTRERRAAVLGAVLGENRPTGELERRREALKQIMKDSGRCTDPHALATLGFRLVSGRTHWKIDYAGIRMPMSKTPSDYRSNLNTAADMANRCF